MSKNKRGTDIVLEPSTRLAHSLLWKLQTLAYTEFGPQAWTTKGVPSYVTSNPYIARSYAQVVIGYLRDCLAPQAATPIDLSAPLYILDLGAGTGRFGYLFLKSLHQILNILKFPKIKVRYVMTDIAPANIAFWKAHPYLQPFIEAGWLDFAIYKHDQSTPLRLELEGTELKPGSLVNPLIVIGNYFFDTIPQDLFKVEEGQILEGRVALSMKRTEETEELSSLDPRVINHLKSNFEYVSIPSIADYYPERPELLSILKRYAETLEGIPFMFPEGAFKVIRYFETLSQDRMLLLAGDQGKVSENQLKKQPDIFLSLHGSFSIGVNYHAIAQYFRNRGCATLLTTFSHPGFVVTASIVGGGLQKFPETHGAFDEHIDRFEPYDYFLLVTYTEEEWAYPNLDFIFLLIKAGRWDPFNFNLFYDRIRSELRTAAPLTRDHFLDTVHRCWENFYPTAPEEANFVMNLAILLYDMERYDDALVYLERALQIDPKNALIYNNIACCYHEKGDQAKYEEYSRLTNLYRGE